MILIKDCVDVIYGAKKLEALLVFADYSYLVNG
jgi:hypothetical protein